MSNELKAKKFTDFFDWFNQSDYKHVPDDVKTAMLYTWSICVNNIPESLLQRPTEPKTKIAEVIISNLASECERLRKYAEKDGRLVTINQTAKDFIEEATEVATAICEEGK